MPQGPPHLTRWRFVAGAAYGLLMASGCIALVTLILDPLIWQFVHRGPHGTLAEDSWYGFTLRDLHATVVVAALVLVPLVSVLQIRPRWPALVTRLAAFIATPLSLVAFLLAGAFTFVTAYSWLWVCLD